MNQDVVENFYGCYLLYCTNPKFKGRTYIGFTVDPNRRLKQHNKGSYAGGARRTSNRGPWEMVLIVHGFPNEISALRFEWAWQHPQKSRRLRHLPAKSRKESVYEYRVHLLSHMLQVGPWNRLPLTIRWLTEDRVLNFKPFLMPPSHMPITHGPVKSLKIAKPVEVSTGNEGSPTKLMCAPRSLEEEQCFLCRLRIAPENKKLRCLVPKCQKYFHPICLWKHFQGSDEEYMVPVQGLCPGCHQTLLWGDLVRFSLGCYRGISQMDTSL